jgi:hypothetical protein
MTVGGLEVAEQPAPEPPRVFISYSYDSAAHKEWVRRLAVSLREDGINARLDVWDLKGRSIPAFMNSEVRNAKWVILICTPEMRAKVHAAEDRERSTGVGWEADLLGSEMFVTGQDKVVAVLARGSWAAAAPSMVAGRPYFDLSSAEQVAVNYPRLRNALIVGLDAEVAPPIGPLAPIEEPADGTGLFDRYGAPSAGRAPAAVVAPLPAQAAPSPEPDALLGYRADRRPHYQTLEGKLDEVTPLWRAGGTVLMCLLHGPTVERPDALLDCFREFTLVDYRARENLRPAVELLVDWPAPGKKRLESLVGNLLRAIRMHAPGGSARAPASVEEGLRRIGGPILVRARISPSQLDKREHELLEQWVSYWATLADALAKPPDEKGAGLERPLVLVMTSLEYGSGVFRRTLTRLFGGLAQAIAFVDPDAAPPANGTPGQAPAWIQRFPVLAPVPVGEISPWLERHVRPWLKEAFPAKAFAIEDSIREELADLFQFDRAPTRLVSMDVLSRELNRVLRSKVPTR